MIYYVSIMKKRIAFSFLFAATLFVGGTTSENIVVDIATSESTVGVATSANIARGFGKIFQFCNMFEEF